MTSRRRLVSNERGVALGQVMLLAAIVGVVSWLIFQYAVNFRSDTLRIIFRSLYNDLGDSRARALGIPEVPYTATAKKKTDLAN